MLKKDDVVHVLKMDGNKEVWNFMDNYLYSIGVVSKIIFNQKYNIVVKIYDNIGNKIDIQQFRKAELNKIGVL